MLVGFSSSIYADARSSQAAHTENTYLATEAGPIVTVEGGNKKFAVPTGYFRTRNPNYAGRDSWWLEALWPGLTPWREGNVEDEKKFHAPGGGSQVKIHIYFGDAKNRATFLNRLVNEDGGSDVGHLLSSNSSLPDDTLEKRKTGRDKYNLQPYYVDFDRVIKFLNQNGQATSFEKLNDFDKALWKDWYIRRADQKHIETLVRCDSSEVADPPEEKITGKSMIRVPQCEHYFLLDEVNAYAKLNYRRVYLSDWKKIEDSVRGLLASFRINLNK